MRTHSGAGLWSNQRKDPTQGRDSSTANASWRPQVAPHSGDFPTTWLFSTGWGPQNRHNLTQAKEGGREHRRLETTEAS